MTVSHSHRVAFERLGGIVNTLTHDEQDAILGVLTGELHGSARDRLIISVLEKCGGAELLRVAIRAKQAGHDPVNALLDRVGAP